MGFKFVRVEREGHLTIVTLNRPELLNALHSPAHWELHEIFDDFCSDSQQWVAILTGAGRAFSAGNDLKHQAKGGTMQWPPSGFAGLTSRFDCNKPLIAAVNGVAMGGGLEIALACDIVIASDTAKFGLPEPRVGLAALAGGLHRLPRAIGVQRAMGMILTGRHVGAAEAMELGFVTSVVPVDDVMKEARRWADMILQCSPLSVRASKEAVYRGLGADSLARTLASEREFPAVKAMRESEDHREGPAAFAEKRSPVWKGR